MKFTALIFVALLVGVATAGSFTPEYEEHRFRESEGAKLYKPEVDTPAENLLHTSVPEPAIAAAPAKNWVEQVTGEQDHSPEAFSFRATSEVANKEAAPASHSAESGDSRDKELNDALANVKDEIVSSASQIRSEKKWVTEVTKIIETYVQKTRRVNANIRSLQKKVKSLFRKKKQIENLILQRKLEKKLKVATKDLSTLSGALRNVNKKQEAFNQSKKDISGTIGEIEKQLNRLRGEKSSSGSSSSGSESSGSSASSGASASGMSLSS